MIKKEKKWKSKTCKKLGKDLMGKGEDFGQGGGIV